MIIIRIINLIINIAKGITFIFFMFLLAILLASFNLANKESKNPFCMNLNVESIVLEDEMIKEYDYKIECSTIYVYINVIDEVKSYLDKCKRKNVLRDTIDVLEEFLRK